MGRIHVVMKKEDIDPSRWKENSIAVVFDVLLATSTITASLANGAREVIPVLNEEEAITVTERLRHENPLVAGEYGGITIQGFLPPNPLALNRVVYNRLLILSTTNGTVATRRSEGASMIYLCSLLNLQAIADRLYREHRTEDIVLVCSGLANSFCLEDYYGAGGLLHSLIQKGEWVLSDAARGALMVYNNEKRTAREVLAETRVGEMMIAYGLEEDVAFVANENQYNIVPAFSKRTGSIKEVEKYESSR
ncbi:2-phosphosulfolactate phosphatase [Pontibacillus chungwhensis BH030062]|uniref:Probable 2-phosphosulfolactate phosphatase n=1 Tax=Pontibacillus chungwhensis BH030062 TaxID=1385513 RepID=A0A0A2UUW6_9BACI|nr:2-phosphosulfolactate phosphatase [Pontibacillus chungwhensis]KGP90553.1 2-phosphosulfolactate phosphatase [Pontibacillus chungwhensis BH030062]